MHCLFLCHLCLGRKVSSKLKKFLRLVLKRPPKIKLCLVYIIPLLANLDNIYFLKAVGLGGQGRGAAGALPLRLCSHLPVRMSHLVPFIHKFILLEGPKL